MDSRLNTLSLLLLCAAGVQSYMLGAPRSVAPALAMPRQCSNAPLRTAALCMEADDAAAAKKEEAAAPEDTEGYLSYGGMKIRTEAAATAVESIDVYDEFTALDKSGNAASLGLDVKEKLFLDCLDAFYNEGGKQLIPNDDYEQLKLDLQFSESKLGSFSADEIKYILANKRWKMGKSTMNNEEYDALRLKLKKAGSSVALHDEAACNLVTGVCKTDLRLDTGKNRLLYIPGFVAGIILFSEVTFWTVHLDPLITITLGTLPSYFFGLWFTENIFAQKPLVTTAPCPNCSNLLTIYFGDLLNVQTDGIIGKPNPPQSTLSCVCPKCKTELVADRDQLVISTLPTKEGATA